MMQPSRRALKKKLAASKPRPAGKAKPLPVDSWLSQWGGKGVFPEEPRFEKVKKRLGVIEFTVSATLGRVEIEAMTYLVTGRKPQKNDVVRHLPVRELQQASYRCLEAPSRRNPDHADIASPVDHDADPDGCRRWWADTARVTLKEIAARNDTREEAGRA